MKNLLPASFSIICLLFISANIIPAQDTTLKPQEELQITASDKIRSFAINVEKKRIISLEIKQNGVDVTAELLDPKETVVAFSDHPYSEYDTERIYVVAETTGQYTLKIGKKFVDERGTFNIKTDDFKEALPADLKRAEAEKLFSEAQKLRATGKKTDREKALGIYERAFLCWQQIGDKVGELRALSTLSFSNRLLGRNKESSEIAEQILRFPDLKEYNFYKVDALYQLGQIQSISGKTDEAIKSFRAALTVFTEPSPKQANILTTLSFAYYSNEELDLAEQYFDKTSENIRQFPDI